VTDVDTVRRWVDEAERLVILTGAGISTDSGIPDFRGPQGVWTKNPAAEKASNIRYYVSDPEVRRTSWRMRLDSRMFQAEPNVGHLAIAALDKKRKLHALVTQNVDGLHIAAGLDPEKVIEVHGNVREWMCLDCDARGPMGDALERVRSGELDPRCLDCGGILKSATISFGQSLRAEDIDAAQQAAFEADLLLAVGTTLGVYPVAGMVPLAKQTGARVVIINAEPTEMDDVADAVLRGPIKELLPAVLGVEPA
jgi:NAD-dependent deacetylase